MANKAELIESCNCVSVFQFLQRGHTMENGCAFWRKPFPVMVIRSIQNRQTRVRLTLDSVHI